MTSPTQPHKESLRDRISTRLSTDSRGRHIDEEARHTRNVTWAFYGLIVVVVVVIVGALIYGFWEANFKPAASVQGTDVSRGELDGRASLLEFRADRASAQTTSALSAGDIDAALANQRFAEAEAQRPTTLSVVAGDLADLIFKEQLAADEGVTLDAGELESAIAADGSFPEARFVDAVIVLTEEQEQGAAATDAGIAEARERAEQVVAGLEAGGDPEELAETYGPASHDSAWLRLDTPTASEAWNEAVFAAAEGDVTEPVESVTGEQLVAIVREILPEDPDEGFIDAVNRAVGEGVHQRNVELEALAGKLEAQVVEEALAAEYEQVELAEIFIERNQANPDDTAVEARASHILYEPEAAQDEDGEPIPLASLPADDPAWDAAEAEAQAAFDELAAIEDVEARKEAFAERARSDSDGPTGPRGGDLGWFARESMVSEFSDAIWENVDPESGEILGPVRSEFGWHVILFDEFRSSLDQRVAAAEAALAEDGADFAAVAAEHSDGPDADEGGATGWHVIDLLDEALALEMATLDSGDTTQPVDEGDGYRIYQKLDAATRPLDEDVAADVAATAFDEWYFERYDAADITIDAGLDE
jgi:peptidyl-prolyl cis-trans isomerase C